MRSFSWIESTFMGWSTTIIFTIASPPLVIIRSSCEKWRLLGMRSVLHLLNRFPLYGFLTGDVPEKRLLCAESQQIQVATIDENDARIRRVKPFIPYE